MVPGRIKHRSVQPFSIGGHQVSLAGRMLPHWVAFWLTWVKWEWVIPEALRERHKESTIQIYGRIAKSDSICAIFLYECPSEAGSVGRSSITICCSLHLAAVTVAATDIGHNVVLQNRNLYFIYFCFTFTGESWDLFLACDVSETERHHSRGLSPFSKPLPVN